MGEQGDTLAKETGTLPCGRGAPGSSVFADPKRTRL